MAVDRPASGSKDRFAKDRAAARDTSQPKGKDQPPRDDAHQPHPVDHGKESSAGEEDPGAALDDL